MPIWTFPLSTAAFTRHSKKEWAKAPCSRGVTKTTSPNTRLAVVDCESSFLKREGNSLRKDHMRIVSLQVPCLYTPAPYGNEWPGRRSRTRPVAYDPSAAV